MKITQNDIKSIIIQLKNLEITNGEGIFKVFKEKIKKIFNTKYCILTNNGTSALYLAYKAIGLKHDSNVITGTYTYHSTNSTILNFTKNIIFCDYDDNITISIKDIEKYISDKTKLLIIPHTWGLSPNMDKIIELKRKYKNLYIIEDCSQAHFSKYNGRFIGTFGDIGIFSMQAGKLLSAGEGGFIITNNKNLYEKMIINSDSGNSIKNLINKNSSLYKDIDTGLGLMKFRPNTLGIALANSQLESINIKLKIRKYFANFIKKELKSINFIFFPNIKNLDTTYYKVVGFYKEELNNNIKINDFLNILRKNNLFDVYNPQNNKPNHLIKLFKENINNINGLKKSEKIYNNILVFDISDDINDKIKIINYIKNLKIICKK